jgi:hypothetical protein
MINIKRQWTEYPDLDLIELSDGRVIGITSESICLYPNEAAVFPEDGEQKIIACISLIDGV